MPYFIKTGFWEKLKEAPKGFLNLNQLIQSIGGSAVWGNITGNIADQLDLEADFSKKTNDTTVLVDAGTIDLAETKNILTSSSGAITFTVSYLGDDVTLEVILNTTTANYTFPAGSLTVSEGSASGDNILALAGSSGDHYLIAIKKINGNYRVVSKNFGQ